MYVNIILFSSESAPEEHLEKLQKECITANALNTVAPHSCIQHLTKISPQPELFVQKYEELKSKKLVDQYNQVVTYIFSFVCKKIIKDLFFSE